MNKWGKKSLLQINKPHLHPYIKEFLVWVEIYLPNCSITETERTLETQKKYFKDGTTKCDGVIKKSAHQVQQDGYCYAFDIVPSPSMWGATQKEWIELHEKIKDCWNLFETHKGFDWTLVWGGNFGDTTKSGKGWDKPHYELRKVGDNK